MPPVVPIILAAGMSRRMGRTKALLRFDGRTCLSLVLESCRQGGASTPLVVLGHDAESVRAVIPPGPRACTNPAFGESGPAASLRIALDQLPAEAEALLLFPVDYPLVSAAVIRALLERWAEVRPRGRRIVVPSHGRRRGHPAIFDRGLWPELRALGDHDPIHRVVRAHEAEIEHMETDDPAVLMDMNTPEDYRRCLAAYRDRHP